MLIGRSLVCAAAAVLLLGAAVRAQSTAPFVHPGDLLVCDTAGHRVIRLQDLDLDGTYNGVGENTVFWTSGNNGVICNSPSTIAVGPDGTVYIADQITPHNVVALRDLDGDGTASGVGESTVFLASGAGNAGGFVIPSLVSLACSVDGSVYLCTANSAGGGIDAVYKLHDNNHNFTANDAGEAVLYAQFGIGQPTAYSVPTAVAVGPDGTVYVLENGSGGATRGIYRLHDDVVANGVCTDAGEISLFYAPTPPVSGTSQYFGLTIDRAGNFFVQDTNGHRILRVRDLNNDHLIQNGSEEVIYFSTAGTAAMWASAVGPNGALHCVEDTFPDRIYRLTDTNLNGVCTDAGEKVDVYTFPANGTTAIYSPRSLAFMKGPGISVSPLPVPIGGNAVLTMEAGAGELMNVYYSVAQDNTPLPPYGVLQIDIATPGFSGEFIPVFYISSSGSDAITIPVPNDPSLASLTLYFQGVGGWLNRLQLTNAVTVTFQ